MKHPATPPGFTHTIAPDAPRFNLVEKSISREEALEHRVAQLEELVDELNRLLKEPLPTTKPVFERTNDPDAAFEECVVVHPRIFDTDILPPENPTPCPTTPKTSQL